MLINKTNKKILSRKLHYCSNIFSRGAGLMFRAPKAIDDCAWIFKFASLRRESLTMAFVFYPLDVMFLDDKKIIVEIKENFRPWELYIPSCRAQYIIEIANGSVHKSKTQVGDKLDF